MSRRNHAAMPKMAPFWSLVCLLLCPRGLASQTPASDAGAPPTPRSAPPPIAVAHVVVTPPVIDGRELRSPTDTLLLEPPLRIEASGSERAVVFYPTGLAAGARWIVRTSEGHEVHAAVIEVSLLSGEVVVRRP